MVGVEDGSSDQKALEALLHNLPLPSAVQAKTSTPSPSPAATPPGTPSSQKKTPGKGKLLSSISILRSYDTLYRWHLFGIGQTKIIYYNLPDITGKIEKKLIFIEYVPILIIPAYYK